MADYRIAVNKVIFDETTGRLIKTIATLGVLEIHTETSREEELLYVLACEGSALEKLLSVFPDGYYTLVVIKKVISPNIYAYRGWMLTSKHKDLVFWHTKWLNVGDLCTYNIHTDYLHPESFSKQNFVSRDIREEVRNKPESARPALYDDIFPKADAIVEETSWSGGSKEFSYGN